MSQKLQHFLAAEDISGELINTGELSDSLMQEGEDPFSTWLMSQFDGSQNKALFVTKGLRVKQFLKNDWQENAVLSWSINADQVA